MTMNVHYMKAADIARQITGKGNSMWKELVLFSVNVLKDKDAENTATDKGRESILAEQFKKQEEEYKVVKKASPNDVGAYRSAKSVCREATKYGVTMVDAEGEPLGKTAVEKAIAALKTSAPKSELEKFQATMGTATAILGKLESAQDLVAAMAAIMALRDKAAELLTPKAAELRTGTEG